MSKKIWGKYRVSKKANKKLKKLALRENLNLCQLVSDVLTRLVK